MIRCTASAVALMAVGLSLLAGQVVAHEAAAYAPYTEISAQDQVTKMGRGVNIIGYDPYWQDGGKGNYTAEHFEKIHKAGFTNVRVVLFTFSHMGPDGKLDPVWLSKLDWVVNTALANHLQVVLDEHDFDMCSKNTDDCQILLKNVWSQLAERYKDKPNGVMFEILNEPHDKIEASVWNRMVPQVLSVIRQTNPTRNVVVGPTHWNSKDDLQYLKLPEDDQHLIVTFHYYDPFRFTHQGASWAPPEITAGHDIHFGNADELKQIDKAFDQIAAWGKAHNRPVFLGEFGAYDKVAMDDRVKWTNAIARSAEAHGFATAYWQFSSDFIVYDFKKQAWVEPILHALIPDTKE